MAESLLRCLRESESVADLFWNLCDFRLLDEEIPDWFAFESGNPFQVIARDGAGGYFCLYRITAKQAEGLLYVDSEGQAGTIADSLAAGVQMMVALPYWRDCLKFSGGGDIREMQKAQVRLESDLRQRWSDIEMVRRALYRAFDLVGGRMPMRRAKSWPNMSLI